MNYNVGPFIGSLQLLCVALVSLGCGNGSGKNQPPGKHVHQLMLGGLQREFIVYVPSTVPSNPPAVLMFHGTGGDGEKFYYISGWREKADAEGFVVVFPSSLSYCLHEDLNGDGDVTDANEMRITTKWADGEVGTAVLPQCTDAELATFPAGQRTQADHPIADDIEFLRQTLSVLQAEYGVNMKRVYATGFSNGGGFVARAAQELSEKLAATAVAAGKLGIAPRLSARPISLFFSVGTEDDGITQQAGVSRLPLDESLMANASFKRTIVTPFLTTLGLIDRYAYTAGTVAGSATGQFTYDRSTIGASNRLEITVMSGVTHQYPNGSNHPIRMPDLLWPYFAPQSLP